jgi:hypothetical protein
LVGEPSLIAGSGFGLIWATASTKLRRHRYAKAGLLPKRQIGWFLSSLLSMGSYATAAATLLLLGINGALPMDTAIYVLATVGVAFCSALLFARFQQPPELAALPRVELSRPEQLRKSA